MRGQGASFYAGYHESAFVNYPESLYSIQEFRFNLDFIDGKRRKVTALYGTYSVLKNANYFRDNFI